MPPLDLGTVVQASENRQQRAWALVDLTGVGFGDDYYCKPFFVVFGREGKMANGGGVGWGRRGGVGGAACTFVPL